MQRNFSKKIIFVVGTRPNFVKIAVLFPLILKEKKYYFNISTYWTTL